MLRVPLFLFLLATPAHATEFTFSVPIKSGPLLGTIATGTIDLEDGVFTGVGTETFAAPNNPFPNAGDIVSFELTILTLDFSEATTISGPTDFRIVFENGEVTQFSYLGALFNPGASAFLTIDAKKSEADIRTTGGKGEELRSLGGPVTFVQVN